MNTTDNQLHDMIMVSCEEVCEDDRYGTSRSEDCEQPYDGGGWAGDGSGTDDFEDYNQNEAMDYCCE